MKIIKSILILLKTSVFLLLAIVFNCGTLNAQENSRGFLLTTMQSYSLKTNTDVFEIGIGYIFDKVGVRVNYGRVGLGADRKANEETISLFIPVYKAHSFSMIPEVSVGMLNGRFDTNEDVVIKPQVQVGVNVNYTISRFMSCGITYRSLCYDGNVIPLVGWSYSVHF